jgi:hypothetical protein
VECLSTGVIKMNYYNINTKVGADKLPDYVKLADGSVKYTQDIKDHAPFGWRIVPAEPPTASSAEYAVVSSILVQSETDPLKVEYQVTEKLLSVIDQEKADAEKAQADAQAAADAAHEAQLEEIRTGFPDEKMQKVILRLNEERRVF